MPHQLAEHTFNVYLKAVYLVCVCVGLWLFGYVWHWNVTWQSLSLFFVLYLYSPYSPVSLSYLVVSHTKLKLTCKCLCMCVSVQHLSCVLCCLSAQFVPQTQRGDWEDCDHPRQRKRREDQGPGELLGCSLNRLVALEHTKWAQVSLWCLSFSYVERIHLMLQSTIQL